MNRRDSARYDPGFGEWLRKRIKDQYRTQTAFAKKLGVPQGTVSRWVGGRVPDAAYLDEMADLLLVEYDDIATRAGYRPATFNVDPESAEGQLVPIIRQIDWTDRDLIGIKAQLEFLASKQPRR